MPASLLPTSIPLFFPTQLVPYSYGIFRKKKKQFTKNPFYLPDSSMSASSSHSWKARLSSFLFFTHSSSGSVSVSAAGPLYQSPTHRHPPKKKEKKLIKISHCSRNQHFITFQYTVTRFKRHK